MTKLLPITCCKSCWHYDEDYGECDQTLKPIKEPIDIPEWCPLEDAEVPHDPA